ncbi:MAG: GTPase Era [Firmicutes bacterium]|nr:GTPase Era [Bacillota bacterium]
MEKFYSGFVSLTGKPNVGKSTLMNYFAGQKIAITSYKPQTTRNRIQSILTCEDYQIVFIDTPGLHRPKSKLGNYMLRSAETAMNSVDVCLFLIEPGTHITEKDAFALQKLKGLKTPVFLVVNKIDTVEKAHLLKVIDEYRKLYDFAEIVPVSALTGENCAELLSALRKYLPEGPQMFPEDMVTDQPERRIISEFIREKVLKFMQDEIPHGVAVEINSMKKREGRDLVDVEATLYCEKDSHKGMIIGKRGEMLKKIGSAARSDAERLLGSPIYLTLWVRVKKDWRDSDFLLRSFGYDKREL